MTHRIHRPSVAIVAPAGSTGGQAVQARLLETLLAEEGFSVSRLPIDPPFPPGLRWVRRLPCARTLLNESIYLPSLSALRKADVVHVFSASWWSFFLSPGPAMLAARRYGRRVVLNYHSGEAEGHLSRWRKYVDPWLQLADAIVVPSEYLRSVFQRHGYQASVIPNVVDVGAFRFRERDPLRPRLLTTRQLEPHYGVDTTIRAFAQLRRRQPEATLTVAGTGSAEGALRRLASQLGIGGVRFLGNVARGDMPRLYDEADIFVNASVVDNQPLSVLEAFAAGTPVVSTTTGGIGSMVRPGETGLTFPAGDPPAMAEALDRLLEDESRARQLARLAREEVAVHTWPYVRDLWADVYMSEMGGVS